MKNMQELELSTYTDPLAETTKYKNNQTNVQLCSSQVDKGKSDNLSEFFFGENFFGENFFGVKFFWLKFVWVKIFGVIIF